MNLYFFHAATLAALSFAIYQLSQLGKATMSTQEAVDKLTTQVLKIGEEVRAAHAALVVELDAVKEQLAAAGAAEKVDLTGLTQAIQDVDDINPDAVVEAPVEDPVDVPVEDVPADPPF